MTGSGSAPSRGNGIVPGGGKESEVELTAQQIALIADGPLLKAKTAATETVKGHLEAVRHALYGQVLGSYGDWRVPRGFDPAAFQIAKGENLDGTPYQYLDFPKHFRQEDYFTFRTLVWWGRGVCMCWILKGEPMPAWRRSLLAGAVSATPDTGMWFGGDPWGWDGFVPLDAVPSEAIQGTEYLKIGRMLPLTAENLTRDGLIEAGTRTFNDLLPLVSGS